MLPQPTIQYNPQENDPLSGVAKVISLRNLLNAGQTQQLQQQALAQENQQREMAVRDQQIVRQAFVKNNGDLDATIMDAAKAGASPQTLQGLQQHALEVKSKSLDLVNKQGEKAVRDADLIQGAYDTVAKAPPDQRPALYQQAVQGLKQAQVDVSQVPPQYPGDEQFSVMGAALRGHSKQIAEAVQQAEMQKTTGQAAEANAKAANEQAQANFYRQNGGAPGVSIDQVEMSDWLRKNRGKTPADFMKYKATLVPITTFNLQGGGSQFGAADPSVQAVAEGRMKIGDVLTPRTPLPIRKQFLAAVQQANPNFDSRDYDVEKGVEKYMTSGQGGKQLTAFNTAIAHLDTLDKLANDLKNTDIQVVNRAKQRWAQETGNPAPVNFQAAVNAMSGEVASAMKASGATDQEISKAEATFSRSQSPGQLRGAIATYRSLLNSKAQNLKAQYDQGMKAKPNFGQAGQSSGGFSLKAPDGVVYKFKDQQSLDNFKKEAGIQ